MTIIKIASDVNGAHETQTYFDSSIPLMEGWAVIPLDMPMPDTFPYVEVVEEAGIVTSLTPGVVPTTPPQPDIAPDVDAADQLRADVDYLAALAGVEL